MGPGDSIHYRIFDENKITFAGRDFSCKPIVLKENARFLLVKIPGRRSWSGIGMTSYYCPELYLISKHIVPAGDMQSGLIEEQVDLNRRNSRSETKRLLLKLDA